MTGAFRREYANDAHYQIADWRNQTAQCDVDLSQSVDNEYYCLLLAKELG